MHRLPAGARWGWNCRKHAGNDARIDALGYDNLLGMLDSGYFAPNELSHELPRQLTQEAMRAGRINWCIK